MTFLRNIWQWLAGITAILAGLWAVYARGRRAERQRLEREGLREALKRREVRDEAEESARRDPDPAERLRNRWSRD